MVKPKGLLLDFYGTLVMEDDLVVQAICEDVRRRTPDPQTVSAAEVSRDWWARFCALAAEAAGPAFRTQRDLARVSLAATIDAVHASCDPEALLAAQFAYWQAPQLFPDARELLATDLPVCVVSNIDRADLEAALAHHGLTDWLRHVVTSEDARAYKPRPEMFRTALDLLGLAAGEALHVGDSVTSDVAGAARLGIPVAWVNRTARPLPAQRPTLDVRSLTDLAALLDCAL